MWSISPAALPKLFLPLTFSHPPPSLSLSSPLQTLTRTTLSLSFSLLHQHQQPEAEEEEEVIIGDCLVFDKDAFDDPSLSLSHHHPHPPSKPKPTDEIEPQDLIPEKWKPVQAAINISKKERRQLARDMEFGRRVEKQIRGLTPIRDDVSIEDYVAHRDEKLKQISPVVLERPREGELFRGVGEERESDEVAMRRSERVAPRNPRMAVYKGGLEDITQFFNSGEYDPPAAKKTEVGWWSTYGNGAPNLKRMAKRILALTTSSSGCERNWSTFEGIHTKKRNRLDVSRLNNLVYVQFNAKIINKNKKRRSLGKKLKFLHGEDASMAQGWLVEGGDEEIDPATGIPWSVIGEASGADEVLQPRRTTRNQEEARELEEEEFLSEEESGEEEEPEDDGIEYDESDDD